jgi:hypothetical protein
MMRNGNVNPAKDSGIEARHKSRVIFQGQYFVDPLSDGLDRSLVSELTT